MDIITTADLASYLRDATVTNDGGAALYVDLANGLVTEAGGAPLLLLDPLPIRVKAITLEVAARAWRNPNGFSSETVDDYTYRRDSDTRAAGVYLTDAERAELVNITGVGTASAYSIVVGSPLDTP